MLGAHLDSIIKSFYDAILLGLCLLRYLSLKQEKVIYVVLNFACWSMHRPSGFKGLRFGSISRVVLLLFLRLQVAGWVEHCLSESFAKGAAWVLHQTILLAANVCVVLVLFVFCSFEALQVLYGTACVIQRIIDCRSIEHLLEVWVWPVVFEDLMYLWGRLATLLGVWQY